MGVEVVTSTLLRNLMSVWQAAAGCLCLAGRKNKVCLTFAGKIRNFVGELFTMSLTFLHIGATEFSPRFFAYYEENCDFTSFGRKIKINRNFFGILSRSPVHQYILCGVCTQKTGSQFDFYAVVYVVSVPRGVSAKKNRN